MRKLGGYTLTDRLGAGGMGEVWKGRRTALGGSAVDVAIKVLSASKIEDPDARRMFLDEARLSMLLTNSNIVKVFDADESEDKTCFMVMEWVEGLNLSELTDKMRKVGETLPDVIIAYIIGEVLKGLAYAHDLRHGGKRLTIVHRDVSPHNVMLSVSGEVKVMDFGIARVASEETSGVHVKGKVRYMPPEQLRGESREPTLDLFAVGAILHELLDGVKFRSQVIDEARLYGMVLDGQVPPMTRARGTVPKELDDLRQGLLAAKPEDRIKTAREAFRRLSAWPGYRDARFELDEIVRRFSGEGEPQPALPATKFIEAAAVREAPAVQHASAQDAGRTGLTWMPVVSTDQGPTGYSPAEAPRGLSRPTLPIVERRMVTPTSLPTPAEVTVTEAFAAEGSDTGVARMRDSGTNTAVGVSRPPAEDRDKRKLGIVLAFAGVGVLGLALVSVAVFLDEEEDPGTQSDAIEVAKADPAKDIDVAPPAEEDELDGPRVDFGRPAAPPTPVEPVVVPEPPDGANTGSADDGKTETDVVEPEDPQPDEAERKTPTGTEPPKKTKVVFALGPGVLWAEIKLGSRSYMLDAFASKNSSTTFFPPGNYSVSYRTEVDGPWKKAGRIDVPDKSMTITLQKDGGLAVQ